MGMQLTTAQVRDVIGERIDTFDQRALAEETCFFDIGLDSLDQVQILLAIEQRFGLRVADGDFEKCELDPGHRRLLCRQCRGGVRSVTRTDGAAACGQVGEMFGGSPLARWRAGQAERLDAVLAATRG